MFIDIAKYIATVGVIGGVISERMTSGIAVALVVVAMTSFVIGFYTIPPKKEK